MKKKRTPWFPADVEPMRSGIYERMYDEGPYFCYWNGVRWSIGRKNIRAVGATSIIPSPMQDLDWRGLSEQPK